MTRTHNGILSVSLLALLVGACGGNSSPTSPTISTPTFASVAGNWSGTFQGTQAIGGSYIVALVMVLNQSGGSVSGTWATSQANGTVSGSTTSGGSFSGTLTWNGATALGGTCTGTFAVSGSAGGNTLNWTSPLVTGNCTNLPSGITMAAQIR